MRRRAGSRDPQGGRPHRGRRPRAWRHIVPMVWRPGRSPLRRSVDRIEVALTIALVVVFLVGAPFAAMAASDWASHGAAATSRLEQAARHPVAAVVEHGVPSPSNPFEAAYLTQVPVRWTLDGVTHTGTVKVAAGTPAWHHRQDLDQPIRRPDRASARPVADRAPGRARGCAGRRGPRGAGDCFRTGHPPDTRS